jgi:SAM-dependent methyltransferase
MDLLVPKIYTRNGLVKINILEGKRALDVGCGSRKLPGAVGIDILRMPEVDIVHNLSIFPWPLGENEFDVILMSHVLEHMDDLLRVLSEVHRISRSGAHIIIRVPYFRSTDAYTDPTHRHFFTSHSLDYFCEGENITNDCGASYVPFRFRKLGFWYGGGGARVSHNPLRRSLRTFMHRYPQFFDQYLSLLLPVAHVTWELEVIK